MFFILALTFSPLGLFGDTAQAANLIPDDKLREAINLELGENPSHQPTEQDLESLTELTANNKGITDLTGLEYATNLEKLILNDNNIEDLSAIENLTDLEFLDLDNNNIEDISLLGNLTNLIALSLKKNDVEDISALSELTNLENLYLDNNKISNLSPLESYIDNLTDGSLWDQFIELPEIELLVDSTTLKIDNPIIDYNGEVYNHTIDVEEGSHDANNQTIKWDGLTGTEDTRIFEFDGDVYGFYGTVIQPIKWIEISEVELPIPEFKEPTCADPTVDYATSARDGVSYQIEFEVIYFKSKVFYYEQKRIYK